MQTLHLCISLGPLAVYLFMVGLINSRRRPFLTSGARDMAALGIALCGFFIIGPLQLFVPDTAADRFGPYIWLMMLTLYVLAWTLGVLLMRPRLVIYNITTDQLRPLLATTVKQLDPEMRRAGQCLIMPQLDIQLTVEPAGPLRCVQLVAAGPSQDAAGWRKLEIALAGSLKASHAPVNWYATILMAFAVGIGAIITVRMASDPQLVSQQLQEMLRL